MKLALGSVQFGMPYGISNYHGQVSNHGVKEILEYASSVGIDTIDTAIAYGKSEQALGNAGVENFNVISKLPSIPKKSSKVQDWVSNELNCSLDRLGVSSLYGFMLHRPDQIYNKAGERVLKALEILKEDGLIKKIGVSVYDPDELNKLFMLFDFDIIQCPLNIFDRRLINSGWLNKLNNKRVEVHTRSSFLQGLLLMEKDEIPKKFEIWKSYLDKWEEWVKDNNISKLNGCLSYCLSCKGVDKIVVGVDAKSQLEEIVALSNNKIINPFPDLSCSDERLINPSNWNSL